MAEARLQFSLVTPVGELFSDDVDQVDAPGSEGDFGVLVGHAPFMTTLREGRIHVRRGAAEKVWDVKGGFADVTPAGLIILAEEVEEVA